MTRGYTRREAVRMIVTGFFQQVFDRITIESVRDALGEAIGRRVSDSEDWPVGDRQWRRSPTLCGSSGWCSSCLGCGMSAGGMRVVVSGRIDERNRSSKSLKIGLPLLAAGVCCLLFRRCGWPAWGMRRCQTLSRWPRRPRSPTRASCSWRSASGSSC